MVTPRTIRRVSRRLIVSALALALLVPAAASLAQPDQSTVPGKTFAAYRYGWYPLSYKYEFNGPLPRPWVVSGNTSGLADVRTQHGMLFMQSGRHGTTEVTLRRYAHARGRWEIRLKAGRVLRDYDPSRPNFTALAELIPAGTEKQHCGARDIAFASFRPTATQAQFYARGLPDHAYTWVKTGMNLSDGYWHTYAAEVTPRRISWFVDGRVRATERRPDALSGVPLTLRLALVPDGNQAMNPTQLQVDTVRYFTLKSPDRLSTRAPAPVATTYAGAC
jgi:hypothetical protein